MSDFDDNQKISLKFYYDQFKNNWDKYAEVSEQRNEKREYLKRILTRERIPSLTEDDINEIIKSLWTGTLFPKSVARKNDLESIKKSFQFLLYGEGNPYERLSKVCHEPEYVIRNMGPPRISELLGKVLELTIVNSPVENLAERLGYKFSFKEAGTKEWIEQYAEFEQKIKNTLDIQSIDETDFLIYFIEYFEPISSSTNELLPRFDNGEFMFVEEDFASTTGIEIDAKFLYQRFKLLTKSLSKILPEKYVNDNAYTGRTFNRGTGEWTDYVWLAFVPKIEVNKYEQIQFQVSLHQNNLNIMIWFDSRAEEKILEGKNKIEKNIESFLDLLKTLPEDFIIQVNGSSESWKGGEFTIEELDKTKLYEILEWMGRKKAEFSIRKQMKKEQVLSQKLGIINTIKSTFETLSPVYEFFEGKTELKYFILTSYPNSEYDDIEGKQYHYDSNKPNYTKLIAGSKVLWLSKINNVPFFLGTATISAINPLESSIQQGRKKTEYMAKIEEYQKFEEPKPRTDEIQQILEDLPEYGNIPPSILPINKKIYDLITGKTEKQEQMEQKIYDLEYLLLQKNQIILYGPPGTGKTRESILLARHFAFDELSDEEYNNAILDLIKNYSKEHKCEFIKEPTSDHLYSIKNSKKEIRLGIHFSKSEKRDSDSVFVGVPQKMIDYLNKVPSENRFEIIVNNDSRNYAVLPYKTKMQYARFSGGQWDETGKNEHSFHIKIEKNRCKLSVRDGTFSQKELDCTNLLSNLDILELSEQTIPYGYVRMVTFHPSYSYEEFVEGIKAKVENEKLTYEIEDGIFKRICKDAINLPNRRFVLIIDEINRGNISKIFGELITLLENDKRESISINLAYSKQRFTIPKNVFIIGTMNTADRSLVQIDIALRRRFGFKEILPKPELLDDLPGLSLSKLLTNLNNLIVIHTKNRELQIGHSFFMKNGKSMDSISDVKFAFETEIIPLLQEYFYDDYYELEKVIGTNFVNTKEQKIIQIDSDSNFVKALEFVLGYDKQSNN